MDVAKQVKFISFETMPTKLTKYYYSAKNVYCILAVRNIISVNVVFYFVRFFEGMVTVNAQLLCRMLLIVHSE